MQLDIPIHIYMYVHVLFYVFTPLHKYMFIRKYMYTDVHDQICIFHENKSPNGQDPHGETWAPCKWMCEPQVELQMSPELSGPRRCVPGVFRDRGCVSQVALRGLVTIICPPNFGVAHCARDVVLCAGR